VKKGTCLVPFHFRLKHLASKPLLNFNRNTDCQQSKDQLYLFIIKSVVKREVKYWLQSVYILLSDVICVWRLLNCLSSHCI